MEKKVIKHECPRYNNWLERHKRAQGEVERLINHHVDLASICKVSFGMLQLDQLMRLAQILPNIIDERSRGVRQNGRPLKPAVKVVYNG